MKVDVHIVNAFTHLESGGNPAGVCLEADSMSDKQMLAIAAKVNLSETAFVLESKTADVRTRFYTPTNEVPLCGHATIGTFHLLTEKRRINTGQRTQETNLGVLGVNIRENGSIFMEQANPAFHEKVEPNEIMSSLGLSSVPCIEGLPIQIVSTGLRDIIVPVATAQDLARLEPDLGAIAAISRRYGVVGYHVFTLDTKGGAVARCRNFAPSYGIDEESATGTSTGALAAYLERYDIIDRNSDGPLRFSQGNEMHLPSEILVELNLKGEKGMLVGGRARTVETISVQI